MLEIVAVTLGGGLGSLARWLASVAFNRIAADRFPLGTFFVNIAGSFLIGFLLPFFKKEILTHHVQLLLVTGFLGGFTTFSSLMLEGVNMFRDGKTMHALAYLGLSGGLGLLMVALGIYLGEALIGRL
jgi:fluoride exporter